jgi:hypothetical protein
VSGIGKEGTGHKVRCGSIVSFLVIALSVLTGSSVSRAQESSGTLLAYEPFGESGKTPFALNGTSGGGDQGWASAWVEQSGSTAVPGYNIASSPALTYTGLSITPDYATGGFGYQSAGRTLDVRAGGPFASFVSNGLIHAPGQSIWISFLLRQDVSGATPHVGLTAQRGDTAWSTNPANIQIGYFGSSSNDAGEIPRWSLQYSGSTVTTNVAVVKGQTVLFVVEDTFGSNGAADQINLYVNPTSLGGSAPAIPNLQYTPSGSTAFQGITFYGSDTNNQSSLGDIRIGTSYAVVTPKPAIPSIPIGLAATAGIAALVLIVVGVIIVRRRTSQYANNKKKVVWGEIVVDEMTATATFRT